MEINFHIFHYERHIGMEIKRKKACRLQLPLHSGGTETSSLKISEPGKDNNSMSSLPAEERFRRLNAEKSTCLVTSRPNPGITDDLDATFSRLLSELV